MKTWTLVWWNEEIEREKREKRQQSSEMFGEMRKHSFIL